MSDRINAQFVSQVCYVIYFVVSKPIKVAVVVVIVVVFVPKKSRPKHFGSKKYSGSEIFGTKKCSPKNFWSKSLMQKKIWAK